MATARWSTVGDNVGGTIKLAAAPVGANPLLVRMAEGAAEGSAQLGNVVSRADLAFAQGRTSKNGDGGRVHRGGQRPLHKRVLCGPRG